MNIRLLDEAQNDLDQAAQFYENQRQQLGVYFLDCLFSDIQSLTLYAGIHPKISGYFRLLSKTFPYAVYYLVNEQSIDVYAVLDCRSHPNKSLKTLRQRYHQ